MQTEDGAASRDKVDATGVFGVAVGAARELILIRALTRAFVTFVIPSILFSHSL